MGSQAESAPGVVGAGATWYTWPCKWPASDLVTRGSAHRARHGGAGLTWEDEFFLQNSQGSKVKPKSTGLELHIPPLTVVKTRQQGLVSHMREAGCTDALGGAGGAGLPCSEGPREAHCIRLLGLT